MELQWLKRVDEVNHKSRTEKYWTNPPRRLEIEPVGTVSDSIFVNATCCDVCGDNQRYAINNRCVTCVKKTRNKATERDKLRRRKVAAKKGVAVL